MLSKVLSKEACKNCRFCCSFRRMSLWELPRVSVDFAYKNVAGVSGQEIKYSFDECNGARFAVTDLTSGYLTDDPDEEVKCPFLDDTTGCVLSQEDKPFDCSIWPLRYMEMPDGSLAVTLTPTCPEVNKVPVGDLKDLLNDGLGEKIAEYAKDHSYMIKPYRAGFEVLWQSGNLE